MSAMMIDPFADDWLAVLDAACAESAEPVHLLLDGVCLPGLHRKIAPTLERPQDLQLLFERLPGCTDATRDVSPFVVPYPTSNLRLRRLLGSCSGLPMVHALTTPERTDELADRLAQWCAVEADRQRLNLRFTDTRRVAGIYGAFTPRQQRDFFGPIAAWRYVARDGRWAALSAPPAETADERAAHEREPAPTIAPSCVELSADQFARMLDDGEADALLLQLADRGLVPSPPSSVVYATVAAALALAQELQMEQALQTEWVTACLRDDSLLERAQQSGTDADWLERTGAQTQEGEKT